METRKSHLHLSLIISLASESSPYLGFHLFSCTEGIKHYRKEILKKPIKVISSAEQDPVFIKNVIKGPASSRHFSEMTAAFGIGWKVSFPPINPVLNTKIFIIAPGRKNYNNILSHSLELDKWIKHFLKSVHRCWSLPPLKKTKKPCSTLYKRHQYDQRAIKGDVSLTLVCAQWLAQ